MLRWLIVALLLVCPVTALAASDYQIDVTWQLDTFTTRELAEHWNTWSTAAGWTSLRAMFMEDKGTNNLRSDMGVPWQVAPITLTSGLNYTQTEQGSPQGSTYADRGVPFWQFSSGADVLSGGTPPDLTTGAYPSHTYHAAIDIDDEAEVTFTVMQSKAATVEVAYTLAPAFWYDASLTLVPGAGEDPPTYTLKIVAYRDGVTAETLDEITDIPATDTTTAYIQHKIDGADATLTYWIDEDTDKAVPADLTRWQFVQSTPTRVADAVDPNPLFTLALRPTLAQASIFVTHTGPLGKLRGVKIQQTLTAATFTTPWGTKTLESAWNDSDFGATPKTSTATDSKSWVPSVDTATWTILSDAIANPAAKEGHVYRTINTLP